MINRDIAAIMAFTALGANLFGGTLLLLLNSGSRSIRWYLPFQAAIMLWLFTQGVSLLSSGVMWNRINLYAVLLMPLLFLAFALNEAKPWPARLNVLMLASGLLAVPFVAAGLRTSATDLQQLIMWTWMVGGWIGGSLVLWRRGRREALLQAPRRELRKKLVVLGLLLIAPISVIGAMVSGGSTFIFYAMPIVTVCVLFLLFYGITRMQFYDVEVRVRRTGEIAADTVEMERLAVLGELAATIAHEVRNPLTGVKSLAQRIAHDDVPADKRRRYGEVILEETGRVERLVTNLLELSRRGARKEQASSPTTQLQPLFDDVLLLIGSRAERAQVRVFANAHDLTAPAPREALVQIVLNLALNAIAHSPENQVVSIRAEENAGAIIIVVRDHGNGVGASECEKIFDPFYTTTVAGTGLGLSVVRHLARENNWTISVNDAPGGGAEFTLRIPAFVKL